MNRTFSLGLAVALAVLSAGKPPQAQRDWPLTVRVVDAAGQPLAEGAEVQAWLTRYQQPRENLGCLVQPKKVKLTVQPEGQISIEHLRPPLGPPTMPGNPRLEIWLHLEHTDLKGRRERAFTPLDSSCETVVVRHEELLASGSILDELDAPESPFSYRIRIVATKELTGPAWQERIEPRWVTAFGRYELWGWRADGEYALRARYTSGLASAPVPLIFGTQNLNVVLPATGALQCQLNVPTPFPERGTFAVLRDSDSGLTQRWELNPGTATNHRLRVGCYEAAIEVNGVVVHTCGKLSITHRQTAEVQADLSAVRVFRIEVVDAQGQPIPAAQVRVASSRDITHSRQLVQDDESSESVILVATTKAEVDIEVFDFKAEFQPSVIKDVRGNLVAELKRKERRNAPWPKVFLESEPRR